MEIECRTNDDDVERLRQETKSMQGVRAPRTSGNESVEGYRVEGVRLMLVVVVLYAAFLFFS